MEENKPNPVGRPTKYDPSILPLVQKVARLGATVPEIAEILEVHVATVKRWAVDHEEFCAALNVGRDAADDRVVRSLYQKAIGYDAKVKKILPSGEVVEYNESFQPDTSSMIFWLKNRRPKEWRDRKEEDGEKQLQPIINVNLPGVKSDSSD